MSPMTEKVTGCPCAEAEGAYAQTHATPSRIARSLRTGADGVARSWGQRQLSMIRAAFCRSHESRNGRETQVTCRKKTTSQTHPTRKCVSHATACNRENRIRGRGR